MNFNKHAQKGNLFLKELAKELGDVSDINRANRLLRAVLHTLRNHIPQRESFQFISQLPMMLKALYVDGWIPTEEQKSSKKKEKFIEEVLRNDYFSLNKDFSKFEEGLKVTKAVFRVLKKHVSEGEYKDIEATLPKKLKDLLKSRIQYKKIKLENVYQLTTA